MGLPKATLPFGPESMIQRVLRLLGKVVRPLVVVAGPRQDLPELSHQVIVARDRREGRGPLEGLRCGLDAMSRFAEAAYVTGCDVPLLVPGFVEYLVEHIGHHQVVVPFDGLHHHPLAAVYRTDAVADIDRILAAGRSRPVDLYDVVSTRRVVVEELRRVDPELDTLANVNDPDSYFAALQRAGFEVAPEIRKALAL